MATQEPPAASQRCHWYVYLIGLVPDQVPFPAVTVEPIVADPLMEGAALFDGGVAPVTTAVAADGCDAVPAELCAVTTTTSVWVTSSLVIVYVCNVAREMLTQLPPDESQRCH